MKKLLSLIALVALTMMSCQKDNLTPLEKMGATNAELFFEKVSKMNIEVSDENVIYIDYEWNKTDNTISIINVKEQEPDFLVFPPEETKQRTEEGGYTVECSNGSRSWTKKCDGKLSCGKLVVSCLDADGCATVCKGIMVYVPQYQTFYIGQ